MMLLFFCFTSCKQISKPVVEDEEQDLIKEFVNIDTIHHFKEGDDVKLPVILYAEDKIYGRYFVPMFLYKDGRVIYYKKQIVSRSLM